MALTNPSNRTFTQNTGQVLVATSTTNANSVGLSQGQLLIGTSTSTAPTPATLTAGTGITITNAAGAITIAGQSAAVTYNSVAANTTAVSGQGYIVTNTSTVTLPTPALGSIVQIMGTAGGYTIAPPAGVSIQMGAITGTTSAVSQGPGDTVVLIGVSATLWIAESMIGTFNLT